MPIPGSNPIGGVKQGAAYEGLLYMVLDADLAKIAGLDGLSFRVNAYQIHGRQLSASNIFDLAIVDSIEARPATRLFELWVEQKFGDLALLRVGQLAADNQFFISEFGNTLYINSTFGWPTIFEEDLPSTGPNYPLATPGVRLKVTPNDRLALLAGLYDGDPAGAGFTGTEQIKDPAGLNFRLRDPPLLMAEAQYKYNQDKTAGGLAGTIKLGGWYHFGKFDDEFFDVDGKSLADPSSSGVARTHSGNYGIYGVIDQMLWRRPGDDPKKGVGAFARATFSPSDRNLIDLYAEAGVNFMGLWDKRPDDNFGSRNPFRSSLPVSGNSISKKLSLKKPLCHCATTNWWSNSPIRRRSLPAGPFNQIFNTSSIPAAALSIPLILLSGGSPTPPFLHCARRSVFRAG
ncbi:MAG: carbohydrate porin [Methylocella sp.]